METKNIDTAKLGSRLVSYCSSSLEIDNKIFELWQEKAKAAIEVHGRFYAALSIDTRRVAFVEQLADNYENNRWLQTDLFSLDDLYVPQDHEASAAHLLYQKLIEPLELDKKIFNFIPFAPTVHRAAVQYASDLRKKLKVNRNELPEFDMVVLDLKKAGQLGSYENIESVVMDKNSLATVVHASKNLYPRISLSMPVIKNAKTIVLVAQGSDAHNSLDRWLNGELEQVVNFLDDSPAELIVLTDRKNPGKINE